MGQRGRRGWRWRDIFSYKIKFNRKVFTLELYLMQRNKVSVSDVYGWCYFGRLCTLSVSVDPKPLVPIVMNIWQLLRRQCLQIYWQLVQPSNSGHSKICRGPMKVLHDKTNFQIEPVKLILWIKEARTTVEVYYIIRKISKLHWYKRISCKPWTVKVHICVYLYK